ncbi:MAG: ATP synthase F1 subunit epsilon [Lachnospiraceae bacterium]|nr:ATP synthase F1 subunit epsilon [Lachnospiraceae bacterium]
MNSFNLKVIASDKVFYDGKCECLIVPALDGELAVMAHHQNMVVAITVGELRFREPDSDAWRKAVVGIGFVHVAHNRVTVMVDTAERPEDIDEVRAQEALERAQEQLRQKQSIQEYHVSQASLARAMYRLKRRHVHEIK